MVVVSNVVKREPDKDSDAGAGGRERRRPAGRGAVSRDKRISLGLFADTPCAHRRRSDVDMSVGCKEDT
jgi:hypothetical protein